jgi:hypothetical protein
MPQATKPIGPPTMTRPQPNNRLCKWAMMMDSPG